jgi:uncharacterized protein (DUF433 family)
LQDGDAPLGHGLGFVCRNRGLGARAILDPVVSMDYEAHFVRDPKICGGETVFRGSRVLLRAVLADLAAGNGVAEILGDFPTLTEEQLRAAIALAAAAARDDMPMPAFAGSR